MNNKPFFIIISGPSGSGKTTLSQKIISSLSKSIKSVIISQDDFYNEKSKIPKTNGIKNFDHPKAVNWKLLKSTINDILFFNKKIEIYKYDFKKSKTSNEKIIVDSNVQVVVLEGLFALYDKEIVKMADLTVFVDTQLDECILRRIERDIHERDRNIDDIIKHWREIVKPMYKLYIEPLKYDVDIIIPWDESKENSIKLITNGITI